MPAPMMAKCLATNFEAGEDLGESLEGGLEGGLGEALGEGSLEVDESEELAGRDAAVGRFEG
jgi:hypothetical protein